MTTYTTTSGPWFHVTNGQIDQQSWGVPVPLQQSDISVIMAAGWFPGVISGQLPAIPGTPAGSTTAFDPNYSYQPVTNTLAGQQVNVVYGAPVALPAAQVQSNLLALAQAAYAAALEAGLTIASTGTPALNGTYDVSNEANIAGSEAAVAAGVFRGYYRTLNGTKIVMTGAQFTAVATALYNYIASLDDSLFAVTQGGPWVAPANAVTIA